MWFPILIDKTGQKRTNNITYMFDFKVLTQWIDQSLRALNLPDFGVLVIELVLVGIALLAAYAVLAIILI
jgi:NADH-quinone oxidoreductase subunit H